MPPKNQTQRIDDLLGGVTEELLLGDPQHFQDNSIRVERLLLEMVRPDPVQPRRVLPESLHIAFHTSRLTPTQALRELVQLIQVAARQRGRPFNNVLELPPNPDDEGDEDQSVHLSPEEQLLHDLVNLAITIRDDGQVNPLTQLGLVPEVLTMTFDLEHIRSRNPIEEVVAEKFALKKSGSRFVGVEHDSLVVTPSNGMYFWNSRGEHGDVFDFVGRHLLSHGAWNNRDAAQFMEAVRYLAHRAGITLEENINFKKSAAWAERQFVQRLHETLLNTPASLTYVTEKRGWQSSTIKATRLGFMPQDKRPLLADLNLSDSWQAVIQKFPPNMIVYIHTERVRLTYLSGRSIEGKKHYNPPRDIIGERQPYYNHLYSPQAEQVVIVEGQADAITFGEWGIAAVAIGGMQASVELLKRLKAHSRLFVALDNTDDARAKSRSLSLTLKGETYLPVLPVEVKDVNE